MSEQVLLHPVLVFLVGLSTGIIAMLIINKLRSGSVSPGKLKQEMEDYQGQVEAHFEETAKKFKQMATQYQDLYQHLSVGATTLCRPENISPALTDQNDPLKNKRPAPVNKDYSEEKEAMIEQKPAAEVKKEAPKPAVTAAKSEPDLSPNGLGKGADQKADTAKEKTAPKAESSGRPQRANGKDNSSSGPHLKGAEATSNSARNSQQALGRNEKK